MTIDELNTYVVWTAIITPFTEDGEVDFEDLEGLLRDQEEAGNGVVVLGSTGESLNMSQQQRESVATFAAELSLEVPLICGLGGAELPKQKEWVKLLEALNYEGYLLSVPMYAKPGAHGQYEWFSEIMACSKRPFVIYNVPGRAGKALEIDALARVAQLDNFWAVKEASGSEQDFAAYAKAAPNAHMLSGDDPMLPAFAKLGAKGVISVASNVWPEATKEFARQCVAGEFTDENIWVPACEALFVASNPIPAKALCKEQGRIKSAKTLPPLTQADLSRIELLNKQDQVIHSWLSSQQ